MRGSYKKLELPANYCHLLLQSEIEVKLAIQPIQNNLCKLLELYSLGFEYYESIGSHKFKYFQIRMKEVFQQQEAQNAKSRQQFIIASQTQQKNNDISLINCEQAKLIDKKCREQQRVMHLKEIEDKTSVKSTQEQIKSLLLSGDYKAIDLYTKVKFELDMQQKLLEQKLQQRHRRSFKSPTKNHNLKLNSTKTSLLSQSSRKGDYLEEIKENIFEKFIIENDEDISEVNKQNQNNSLQADKKFVYIKQ